MSFGETFIKGNIETIRGIMTNPRFSHLGETNRPLELEDLVNYLHLDGKPDEVILKGLRVYDAWPGGCPKPSDIRMVLDGQMQRHHFNDRMKAVFDVMDS